MTASDCYCNRTKSICVRKKYHFINWYYASDCTVSVFRVIRIVVRVFNRKQWYDTVIVVTQKFFNYHYHHHHQLKSCVIWKIAVLAESNLFRCIARWEIKFTPYGLTLTILTQVTIKLKNTHKLLYILWDMYLMYSRIVWLNVTFLFKNWKWSGNNCESTFNQSIHK